MYGEIIASMKRKRNTQLGGGVDEMTINLYSSRLRWDFDECTRQWFLQCGRGGRTTMGNVWGMLCGECDIRRSWKVPNALAFASDGCGNDYVIREVRGQHCVFFVDSYTNDDFDQQPPTMYASSIYHFWLIYSTLLHRSMIWYSSKRHLLKLDPDLEKYTDFIRPWEEDQQERE